MFGGQSEEALVFHDKLASFRARPHVLDNAMLAHLSARADQLSGLRDNILALIDELSQGTIDRIMGMSDADLATAVVSGHLNLPKH
ncbi:hypothetical protein WK43_09560 [Burkholderia ubonensis]|nr:hypothetical protein WK38_03425 [Burkholderia ubonensis]KVS48039.1 hypothetical protein WK37_08355 [Burkholderia ubonensis]KVS78772.1 hypothetical protein WK42_16085 [Burkholderia ubonensis]KVS93427.1 hypothetical protein WK44_11060 [Burkholderia ubonensis]KVS94172.1 hypothetical protein WK43_09560 [Burkholderia ubonensis]